MPAQQDARHCHQQVSLKDGTRRHYTLTEFAEQFHGRGLAVYEREAEAANRFALLSGKKLSPQEQARREAFYAKGDAIATASMGSDTLCLIKLLPNGTCEVTNGLTGRPVDADFKNLNDDQIAAQRRELTATETGIARGELNGQDPMVKDALRNELKQKAGVEQTAQTPAVAHEISR